MVSLQNFNVGQRVSVCVNERNVTARTGNVWRVVWHWKDARCNYYIEVGGKKDWKALSFQRSGRCRGMKG